MREYVRTVLEWRENTYYECDVMNEWKDDAKQRGNIVSNIIGELPSPNVSDDDIHDVDECTTSNSSSSTTNNSDCDLSTATLPPPPSLEAVPYVPPNEPISILDPVAPAVREWYEERISQNKTSFVFYYHDESVLHKNEYRKRGWQSDEVKALYPKSEGLGFNISDFICAAFGYLRWNGRNIRVIHPIGGDASKGQFWWESSRFLDQMEAASQMHLDIWRLNTERRRRLVRAVWNIDNAPCHRKRADDALNVSKMNVGPGGKQPNNMRNGYWYDEFGVKMVQYMFLETANGNVGKGLLRVLWERGLVSMRKVLLVDFQYVQDGEIVTMRRGQTLKKEHMQRLLEQQQDFVEDAKDCLVIQRMRNHNRYNITKFFPRYYCELNPKENVWRNTKQNYRMNQDFTRKTSLVMAMKIHQSMDQISLYNIRRFIRTAIFFSMEYHQGNGSDAVKQVVKELRKRRKSHLGASVVL